MIKLFELDIPKQEGTRKFSLALIDQQPNYEHGASKYSVCYVFNGNINERAKCFYTDSIKAAYEKFKSEADNILTDYPLCVYEFYIDLKKRENK